MRMRDLAKSDVDMVSALHLRQTLVQLKALMEKLYRRNPNQLKRSGKLTPGEMAAEVFDGRVSWDYKQLQGKRGTACIQLAFQETYTGDRVLAFVAGLASMVLEAYNNKMEFFVIDELDPQKLYNSARNVEIAVWKLSNDRDANGQLFLLSNSALDEPRNLSFERLFGKVIAHQDMMARIISGSTNRTIRHVIQRLMGAVFLPI